MPQARHAPSRYSSQMSAFGPVGLNSALSERPGGRIMLASGSRSLFVVVKHNVGRGRLDAELAKHADNLAAM